MICHSCNNKKCVRLEHLYLGNQRTNMDDVSRGKYHPNRKLSTENVLEIRKMISAGKSDHKISLLFGVHSRAIRYIRDGVTYRYDV